MGPRPRKISESRDAGTYFDLFGAPGGFRVLLSCAQPARAVQRIQGCQVGQTKYRISDTVVADAASITEPPSGSVFLSSLSFSRFACFPSSARALPLCARLLRKLAILFREQDERRLYESGRAFGISIGSEASRIGAAYHGYRPPSTSSSSSTSSRFLQRQPN